MSKLSLAKNVEHAIERSVFVSRWLLLPMYLGLIVIQGAYCIKFLEELWVILVGFRHTSSEQMMLAALLLIDISMLGNLISMILIGGYEIFISAIDFPGVETPRWLRNIGSGTLKVKMGMSLVGITSIHLLKEFVEIDKRLDWSKLLAQGSIHALFLISVLVLVWVDSIMRPPHAPVAKPADVIHPEDAH